MDAAAVSPSPLSYPVPSLLALALEKLRLDTKRFVRLYHSSEAHREIFLSAEREHDREWQRLHRWFCERGPNGWWAEAVGFERHHRIDGSYLEAANKRILE